jgi:hypothetical protein
LPDRDLLRAYPKLPPVAIVWDDGLAYVGHVVSVADPLFRVHYTGCRGTDDEWVHQDSIRWIGYTSKAGTITLDIKDAVASHTVKSEPAHAKL